MGSNLQLGFLDFWRSFNFNYNARIFPNLMYLKREREQYIQNEKRKRKRKEKKDKLRKRKIGIYGELGICKIFKTC